MEGPRHHQYEDNLRYVQQAPDDISRTVDQTEFDDFLALKKDSAPGPDGIPYGAYRCAGGLGSQFLFNANRSLLEGDTVPEHFAQSRTVFIPKTSDTDDVRSPDALRPLTLCNCDCKLLTSTICRGLHWYTMRCIHPSQRCISSRQMTDNIFEIETTPLAHVACAPQESGVLLTDFARCLSQCQSLLDLLCDREHWFACLSLSFFCEVFTGTASHTWNSREQNEDNSLWPEEYDKVVLRVVSFLQWLWIRSSDGSKSQFSQRTPDNLDFLQPVQYAYADGLAVATSSFRELMTSLAPAFRSVDHIAGLNLN